jgi:quercetin dioxygenase-like cupin family protein
MRLLMPDGYKIAPHTHPKVEHVTVISGTFNLGMGEKSTKAPVMRCRRVRSVSGRPG